MKDLFSEYISLNSEEFESLWQDCLFVFDTNVLLNFYRYSNASSLELEDTIDFYKNRVWIPNRVGYEFFEDRLSVISEQVRNYSEVTKELHKIRTILENRKGHPFVSEDSLTKFNGIVDEISEEFSEQERLLSMMTTQDVITKKVSDLFSNRVGQPYSEDYLKSLYKEGAERFKLNRPPGYKDINKPEPNRYGDFVIWKQIIDKAKQEQKSILFVSDDEKEDWVLRSSGKTIGPLPELVREFMELTGQRFHIYSTFRFLKFSYDFRKKIVNQPILDEVKYVGINAQRNHELKEETHIINCVLKLKEGTSVLQSIVEKLQNQGYLLNIDFLDNYEAKITVKVPFEDLVRRFYNHLKILANQYQFIIDDFVTSVT